MSFRPPKTLPILSLFHSAKIPQSRAAFELLQHKQRRPDGGDAYRLDIIDEQEPPTKDQLRQIAEFLPAKGQESPWRRMVKPEAPFQDGSEVAKLLHDQPSLLQRPLVVDWSLGRAAIGQPNLDDIQSLISERLQQKD